MVSGASVVAGASMAAEAATTNSRTATAVAERRADTATSSGPAVMPTTPFDDALPDDAEAPPEDFEPPFDPGPEPEIVVEAAAPAAAPAAAAPRTPARAPRRTTRGAEAPAATDGGIQRYGEAVVREVLGATFLEEVEAPARPGFGERG